MENWPFNEPPDKSAITTVGVLEEGKPILNVAHYADDNLWGFFCGTTDKEEDGRLVSMLEALKLDPSLAGIAHLQPGCSAYRVSPEAEWVIKKHQQ